MISEEAMKKRLLAAAVILALIAAFAIAQTAAKKPAAAARPNTNAPTKVNGDGVKTDSGLQYWEIRVGNGEVAKEGSHVRVHYSGWLTTG
jgi:FKBP-type peptidyl-prolyl cis-trans isomerase